jgi:hypothetical protein
MDGLRFESLTRIVDAVSTRRIALRSALAGAAATGIAAVGLAASSGDIEAKKKKEKVQEVQAARCGRAVQHEQAVLYE